MNLKKLVVYISTTSLLLSVLVTPVFAVVNTKANGAISYNANGLQRYANFEVKQSPSCTYKWNLVGSYVIDFEYQSAHYSHDMMVSNQVGGSYDVSGGYPAGGSYTNAWNGTGTLSGNSINNSVDYTVGAPGTHMDMLGTIAPNGSLSGTWTDNYGGSRSGTWSSTSGAAVQVLTGCNGKGFFHYADAHGDWYAVNVKSANVVGDTAYFIGPVFAASDPSWVGLWLYGKVLDGGIPANDKIWGSFYSASDAQTHYAAQTDPSDGPFGLNGGNIKVH